MFKKRAVNRDENKRKKIRLAGEGAEKSEPPVVNKKRRLTVGYSTTSIAKNPDRDGKNKLEEYSEEEEARKFILSVNDDATREDRLNAEVKKMGSNEKQIRQPPNIRTTLLTDFQPDVCKDFKLTGYCGYGDSCKFLHIRDDFKGGWKLNQEWKIDANEDAEPAEKIDLDKVPINCSICKDEYKAPVVTACGHYFCSSCFTKRVRKDSCCLICGKDTHGVAKMANDLKKLLKKKQST